MIGKTKWLVTSVLAVVLAAAFTSCRVDASTPKLELVGEIISLEIEGQIGPSAVNATTRTVEVSLSEAVDIRNAVISGLELTEGSVLELSDRTILGEGDAIDLSQALRVVVRSRAGYEWTVRARQSIEHRFRVSGRIVAKIGRPARNVNQVGESFFEEHSKRVFAYVPDGIDMTRINIEELKLAPEGVAATYTPSLEELLGEPQAFRRTSEAGSRVREVKVQYRNITEEWSLYIVESDVQVASVDPFAGRAYVTGYGAEEETHSLEYREAAGYDPSADPEAQGWIVISGDMLTGDEAGVFTATLTGLTPETGYLVRAVSGESVSEAMEFMTGKTKELPQAGFEDWHKGKDPRKANDPSLSGIESWCPWPDGGVWRVNRWWDSGNKGATFVDRSGGGNSVATAPGEGCPANPLGKAAKLQTIYIGLAGGKTAGGNIYFGEYGEMYGLNATCRLGHNWSDAKPTKLKGWFKYDPVPIDFVSAEHAAHHPMGLTPEQWMGRPDELHVCVALWASPDGRDVPFEVNTVPEVGKFLDFSRDKEGVIAYGAFVTAQKQDSWAEFTVEMEYLPVYWEKYSVKNGGKLPDNTQLYLLITSSKHCNYFIAGSGRDLGGIGSVMYVDELKLVYD